MNVVFDFGAVLVTWKPAQLLRQVFAAQAATDEAARALAHSVFAHPDWHAFDRGVLQAEPLIDQTAQRLQLPRDTLADLVHGIGERLTPMDGTLEVLRTLCQRRDAGDGVAGVYYLSNMPLPYARLLEQRYDFLRWFDGGIFSGDVKCIKPDPAIYTLLQSRHGLEPQRTVFIDDLLANVQTAQALGWHGIHFESAAQLQENLSQIGL
jgi:putative hydrolase of the HAD superfamily